MLDLAQGDALGERVRAAQGDARGAEGQCAAGAVVVTVDRFRRCQARRARSCPPPAVEEELLDRAGRRSSPEVHLQVVVGLLRLATAEAQRVHREVTPIVPPRLADVDAAEERHLAVDHGEFLMVGASRQGGVVEAKMEAPARHPVEVHALHPFALAREHHVEIPREHADVEVAIAAAEAVQELE